MMAKIGEHMERVIVIRMSSVYDGKELARKIEDELTQFGVIEEILISHPKYDMRYVPADDDEEVKTLYKRLDKKRKDAGIGMKSWVHNCAKCGRQVGEYDYKQIEFELCDECGGV